jgi:D-3-phosphoglycerate dehydrogenase
MKKLGEEGLQKERVEKDKAMFGGREIAGKTLAIIGMGHIGAATAREASALGMNTVGKEANAYFSHGTSLVENN